MHCRRLQLLRGGHENGLLTRIFTVTPMDFNLSTAPKNNPDYARNTLKNFTCDSIACAANDPSPPRVLRIQIDLTTSIPATTWPKAANPSPSGLRPPP
jgi:hypothetical protein